MNSITRILLITLTGLWCCGCGDTVHGKAIAEPQVAVFHSQLDQGDFAGIYAGAAGELREKTPEAKLTNLLDAIHRKLGPAVSTTNVNWNTASYNFKTVVMLVQETKFEKGNGTETFTFSVAHGKAALLGYQINSTDMLAN